MEKKKQHLLAWKKGCRPKQEGGLGIRTAKVMNKALLAKVGWRLLNDKSGLWARVLTSKYKVKGVHNLSWTIAKGMWSSTWRSVGMGVKEVVIPGLSWILGDGKRIRFWADKWLSKTPLMDSVTSPLPAGFEELKISDFWREGSGWTLNQIVPYVTADVRLRLAAVVVDNVTGANDRLSWGETADGQFTVKSAYGFLIKENVLGQNLGEFLTESGKS